MNDFSHIRLLATDAVKIPCARCARDPAGRGRSFPFSFAFASAYSAPPRFTSSAFRWRETGWRPVLHDRLEAYLTPSRCFHIPLSNIPLSLFLCVFLRVLSASAFRFILLPLARNRRDTQYCPLWPMGWRLRSRAECPDHRWRGHSARRHSSRCSAEVAYVDSIGRDARSPTQPGRLCSISFILRVFLRVLCASAFHFIGFSLARNRRDARSPTQPGRLCSKT